MKKKMMGSEGEDTSFEKLGEEISSTEQQLEEYMRALESAHGLKAGSIRTS